ncbi:MAG: glycosyltransferase [Proteobacteria bacterium]|nr:glycosyltransferase [Pseudomonadota bacterium]
MDLHAASPATGFGAGPGSVAPVAPAPEVPAFFWETVLAEVRANGPDRLVALVPRRPGRGVLAGDDPRALLVLPTGAPQGPGPPKASLCPDFGTWPGTRQLLPRLSSPQPRVLATAGLLECLEDPRPLTALLRELVMQNPGNLLVALGPEPGPGSGRRRPAPGARPWNARSLSRFFTAAGFSVQGIVRDGRGRFAVLARAGREAYESFLSSRGLPLPDVRRLVISTEHADYIRAGGIGSFVQECQALASRPPAVVLLGRVTLGHPEFPPRGGPWISPLDLFPESHCQSLPPADLALEAVCQALLYYPGIAHISVQDTDGVGARLAQAARAGLLGSRLGVEVVCHGGGVYLENGFSQWRGKPWEIRDMALERAAIQEAGQTLFPTRFLRDLYQDAGYLGDAATSEIRGLPFAFPGDAPLPEFVAADTLAFFGRASRMKGFPEFVRAVEILADEGLAPGLSRILVLGEADPEMESVSRRLENLQGRFAIRRESPGRDGARKILARLAPRAVALLPYRGDNHPYAVLEAVASGCPFLVTAAGGVPEMIPRHLAPWVLCPGDARSLARGATDLLALAPDRRREQSRLVAEGFSRAWEPLNRAWKSRLDKPPARWRPRIRKVRPAALVLTGAQGRERELPRFLESLAAQTRGPDVILAAGSLGRRVRAAVLACRGAAPGARFSSLAGRDLLEAARETGLATLVLVHPSTRLAPDFFERILLALENQPVASAATSYARVRQAGGRVVRPAGGSGMAGLLGAVGPVNAAFRVSALPPGDGFSWDPAARTPVLAWLARILAAGGHLAVAPRVLYSIPCPPAGDSSRERTFVLMRDLARKAGSPDSFFAIRVAGMIQEHGELWESGAMELALAFHRNPRLMRLGRRLAGLVQTAAPAVRRILARD